MAQDLVDKLPQVQGRNVGVALADKVFVVPMGFLDLKTYALVALGLAWWWDGTGQYLDGAQFLLGDEHEEPVKPDRPSQQTGRAKGGEGG